MKSSQILASLWSRGMRAAEAYLPIYRAAVKAGIPDAQALQLMVIAYQTGPRGHIENLSRACADLRNLELDRLADEAPFSLWAYCRAKFGLGKWRWSMTDEDISDTHRNDFAGWSEWVDQQRVYETLGANH